MHRDFILFSQALYVCVNNLICSGVTGKAHRVTLVHQGLQPGKNCKVNTQVYLALLPASLTYKHTAASTSEVLQDPSHDRKQPGEAGTVEKDWEFHHPGTKNCPASISGQTEEEGVKESTKAWG